MKCLSSLALFNMFCFALSAYADAELSNVVASQRTGTTLVDLSYDLSGADVPGVRIAVELSDDGGTTYAVDAQSLSGDLGSNITNGTGKQIVWDAGADKPDFVSDTMRFRLIVSDLFALIPAGSFMMGDAFSEGSSADLPVHEVQVSGFYLSKHEVSWSWWQEVRDWAVLNGYSDLSGIGLGQEEHPVQSVNRYDAVKWCNAASERAGSTRVYRLKGGAVYRSGTSVPHMDARKQGYRLPTEAEWEKAARGGLIDKRFPWGDTTSHSEANYLASTSYSYDASSGGSHPDYAEGSEPYTAPVGSFAANGYGLYDMAGNVNEWCHDWYGSSYYSGSPDVDPNGPDSGTYRVHRSGSWFSNASECRVAHRSKSGPAYAFTLQASACSQ